MPPDESQLWEEIRRMRTSLQEIRATLRTILSWRKVQDADVRRLSAQVSEMAKADEIAQKVADELQKRGPSLNYGTVTKIVALLSAIVVAAAGIRSLVS